MKGEGGGGTSFLLKKIQVYNINYALLVRSQEVLSRIVCGKSFFTFCYRTYAVKNFLYFFLFL